jgi:manganese/zinc/iron transport system permease protein
MNLPPAELGENLLRVLSLQDHNTRVVLLGTSLLGAAAGAVGAFTLLRKRALIGDALSHATLPGVALAFIVSVALGQTLRSQAVLLIGATVTGILGVAAVHLLERFTRLKQDAAMGIVLSVFYGLGVALLGVAQRMPGANAAGLESFIYGKTASMVSADALLIAAAAAAVSLTVAALFKELSLLSFDAEFAAARGYPVTVLDGVMLALVVAVTVIGLQAVGLILVIALLIIPAAAARFWTHRLGRMVLLSAGLGAAACLMGSVVSALATRIPSGATIVLVAAGLFFFSLLFGRARGIVPRWIEHRTLARTEARRHLLRAMVELGESTGRGEVRPGDLARARAWRAGELKRAVAVLSGEGLIEIAPHGHLRLTSEGQIEAARIVREHRLWELFLMRYADIAPSHVDRNADAIEHLISPVMMAELESLLAAETVAAAIPPSPHTLARPGEGGRR